MTQQLDFFSDIVTPLASMAPTVFNGNPSQKNQKNLANVMRPDRASGIAEMAAPGIKPSSSKPGRKACRSLTLLNKPGVQERDYEGYLQVRNLNGNSSWQFLVVWEDGLSGSQCSVLRADGTVDDWIPKDGDRIKINNEWTENWAEYDFCPASTKAKFLPCFMD